MLLVMTKFWPRVFLIFGSLVFISITLLLFCVFFTATELPVNDRKHKQR